MMKFNIKYSLSQKAGCACFSPAKGTHSESGFAWGNKRSGGHDCVLRSKAADIKAKI